MGYSVTYWTLAKGRKAHKTTSVCFASLNGGHDWVEKVRYMANVDKGLDKKEIDYFLGFMAQILNGKLWKRRDFFKPEARRILYVLDCKGMSATVRLLYLTVLRYVDEYPELIKAFVARTKEGDKLEDRFSELQKIHLDANANKIKMKYGNLSIHGLLPGYYSKTPKDGISIKTFLANVKEGTRGVNSMFEP